MKDLQNNPKDNPKNDDNMMVKVFRDGEFLSYCRASKARKLIKNKKANEVWKDGEFCIELVNGESKMENLENNDVYTYIHFKNGKMISQEIDSKMLEVIKEKLDDNSFILNGRQNAEEMYRQFRKLFSLENDIAVGDYLSSSKDDTYFVRIIDANGDAGGTPVYVCCTKLYHKLMINKKTMQPLIDFSCVGYMGTTYSKMNEEVKKKLYLKNSTFKDFVDRCEPNYKILDYKMELIKKLKEFGYPDGYECLHIRPPDSDSLAYKISISKDGKDLSFYKWFSNETMPIEAELDVDTILGLIKDMLKNPPKTNVKVEYDQNKWKEVLAGIL